jgi:hypothetical protein
MDDSERRKHLNLPGLELRPFIRPARTLSLYRLSHPGSLVYCRYLCIQRVCTVVLCTGSSVLLSGLVTCGTGESFLSSPTEPAIVALSYRLPLWYGNNNAGVISPNLESYCHRNVSTAYCARAVVGMQRNKQTPCLLVRERTLPT